MKYETGMHFAFAGGDRDGLDADAPQLQATWQQVGGIAVGVVRLRRFADVGAAAGDDLADRSPLRMRSTLRALPVCRSPGSPLMKNSARTQDYANTFRTHVSVM